MKELISVQEIKKLLDYDCLTGVFRWRESRRKVMAGDIAGCNHPEGYLMITVKGSAFKGGDLAWIHHVEEFPPKWGIVSHKDGNRLNCKFENIGIVRKAPSFDLKDMVDYDPESGQFSWRYKYSPIGKPLIGSPGWKTSEGYIRMSSGGKEVQAHRFAYLIMTGNEVPAGMDIDHINGDREDNRWCNLRVVTRTQNLMNSITRADNKSGVKGVYWDPRRELWQAEIKVKGKREHLGRFKTIEEAAAARESAEKRLFGEYSYRESRGTTNEINQ